MLEAVARVGLLWTAASVGVEEIDLVHDRTADSIVRLERERTFDRALTELEASLEDMTVISRSLVCRPWITNKLSPRA